MVLEIALVRAKRKTSYYQGAFDTRWIYISESQTSSFYNSNSARTIDFFFSLLILAGYTFWRAKHQDFTIQILLEQLISFFFFSFFCEFKYIDCFSYIVFFLVILLRSPKRYGLVLLFNGFKETLHR